MRLLVFGKDGYGMGSLALVDEEWIVVEGDVGWVLDMQPRREDQPDRETRPREWARAITPYGNGYVSVRLHGDRGDEDPGARVPPCDCVEKK